MAIKSVVELLWRIVAIKTSFHYVYVMHSRKSFPLLLEKSIEVLNVFYYTFRCCCYCCSRAHDPNISRSFKESNKESGAFQTDKLKSEQSKEVKETRWRIVSGYRCDNVA